MSDCLTILSHYLSVVDTREREYKISDISILVWRTTETLWHRVWLTLWCCLTLTNNTGSSWLLTSEQTQCFFTLVEVRSQMFRPGSVESQLWAQLMIGKRYQSWESQHKCYSEACCLATVISLQATYSLALSLSLSLSSSGWCLRG